MSDWKYHIRNVEGVTGKTLKGLQFSLYSLVEDSPVRGNAMCSGDEAFDREVEDKIINRLAIGDLSAWFCLEVVGEYRGLEVSAYLGGCSYGEMEWPDNSDCDDLFNEVESELISQIDDLSQGLEDCRRSRHV